MKIAIIGSMSHFNEMKKIKIELEKKDFEVEMPFFDETANYKMWDKEEAIRVKLKHNILKSNFEFMKRNDLIFVFNKFEKNGIKNYIGGNTFLEMGFAYVLKKKIFLLNEIPNISYESEIVAMKPIVLNGNLDLIK
jgi:nucleoside 2-deoxyribosyltransferase